MKNESHKYRSNKILKTKKLESKINRDILKNYERLKEKHSKGINRNKKHENTR